METPNDPTTAAGEHSRTEELKAKAQAVASQAADKAGVAAQDAAARLSAAAKEQFHLFRERAPEVLFANVDEAAASNARRTEANLAYYRENPSMIARRLAELDEEWDTRRVLQVSASGLMLGGFFLSVAKSRIFKLLPVALATGALHHGLTGQSPAEDLVRRLGFRTRDEIEFEKRQLLKIDLAGDGVSTPPTNPTSGGMTNPSMG